MLFFRILVAVIPFVLIAVALITKPHEQATPPR
jgi:hypothetical protein